MKNWLKEKLVRFGKRKSLTFSDEMLGQIGEKFTYTIEENRITIHKSVATIGEVHEATFSRKQSNGRYIPLVDLRNKDVREWLQSINEDGGKLHLAIGHDHIVVTPIQNDDEMAKSGAGDTQSVSITASENAVKRTNNVTSIQSFLKRSLHKVRNAIRMEKGNAGQLKAVAGYEQVTFDLFEQSSVLKSLSTSQQNILKREFPVLLEVTEFFCGAGLLSQGFTDAGFDIRFALDANDDALQTYRNNFDHPAVCMDIREFNKTKYANTPVIVGGPPCQGFSSANRKTGFLENPNNFLVREFIKAVKRNDNCKVFVMENVPQILTAGDGAFKNEILSELADFDITYGVLNSADYGSAQMRKRAIFIGSKIGKIELPTPFVTSANYKTVGEAFEGIESTTPNQCDYSKPKDDTVKRMSFVPQGGNWQDIPDTYKNAKMLSGKTHSSVYRRLSEDQASTTIVNPRKSLITHPKENRILSIRECARLFDLPDTFTFKGSISAMQQAVCNGVPAKLGAAIAKVVRIAIEQYNIRTLAKEVLNYKFN